MGALSLLIVVAGLALLAAWATAAALLPAWTQAARRWPWLTRTALLAAATPWVVGGAVTLAALLPGDPHIAQAFGCHCLDSMPAWLHLCPAHPEESAALLLPALLTLVALLPGRLPAFARLLREPLGQGGGAAPRVLELGAPVALLIGWWRPTLVVDQGLWRALSEGERAAVLAHEHGHLQRRDPQVLALLRALLAIGPNGVADTVARLWLDRAELLADADAARTVGDPRQVAAALLRCARLGASTPTLALGWAGGPLERRVHALLDPRQSAQRARPDVGLIDLLVLVALVSLGVFGSPWLHHKVEHLLNLPL